MLSAGRSPAAGQSRAGGCKAGFRCCTMHRPSFLISSCLLLLLLLILLMHSSTPTPATPELMQVRHLLLHPTIILNFFFLPSCSLLSAPPLCKAISCFSYSAEYGISCLGSHHSLKTNNLENSRLLVPVCLCCKCPPRDERGGAIPFIHLFRALYDEIQPRVLFIYLFLSFRKTEILDRVE